MKIHKFTSFISRTDKNITAKKFWETATTTTTTTTATALRIFVCSERVVVAFALGRFDGTTE